MAKFTWCRLWLDEFDRLADLTDEERRIIEARMKKWSYAKQSQVFHMSERTIGRRLEEIRKKYDAVQPYSDILPPRDK